MTIPAPLQKVQRPSTAHKKAAQSSLKEDAECSILSESHYVHSVLIENGLKKKKRVWTADQNWTYI